HRKDQRRKRSGQNPFCFLHFLPFLSLDFYMKKAALKKYGLNFCSKKAPEKPDASCCNIHLSVFPVSDFFLCGSVDYPFLTGNNPACVSGNLRITPHRMLACFYKRNYMIIKIVSCGKCLFAFIALIHPIALPVPFFFPMTNLFFCRNIYDPNLFFGLRCCCWRSSRL
uniref:hypothetical protein n=1 Tax=Hominenteromicrobium sp. TaxID=3073581 RepID=UPI003A8CD708